VNAEPPRPETSRRAPEDMRGIAAADAAPERLKEFLAHCAPEAGGPDALLVRFERADETADRNRHRYEQSAALSALGGTVAIVLAILQLAFHHQLVAAWEQGRRLPAISILSVEVLAIAFTFFSVARSLVLYRQEGWLLWRYKAERLRLLFYRLLTSPDYWTGREPAGGDFAQWIGREVSEIEVLTRIELQAVARSAPVPEQPGPKATAGVDQAALEGLVNFYRSTRLSAQMAYFQARAQENPLSWDNPRVLPFFFFSSVAAVFVHFGFEIASFAAKNPQSAAIYRSISVFFLLCAAVLPAVWAGIKTWRSAHEFTRNAARAAASLGVLKRYSERLGKEKDPARVFATLDLCETFLDAEQREWLRLMLEADWY
jgi:hypothetical protein